MRVLLKIDLLIHAPLYPINSFQRHQEASPYECHARQSFPHHFPQNKRTTARCLYVYTAGARSPFRTCAVRAATTRGIIGRHANLSDNWAL